MKSIRNRPANLFGSDKSIDGSEVETCCEGYEKASWLVTSPLRGKQGYTLFPKLFSLFINYLDSFITNNREPNVSLDWFRILFYVTGSSGG